MEHEVNQRTTVIAIQTSEKAGQAFVHGVSNFIAKQHNALKKIGSSNQNSKDHGKEMAGKMVKIKDLRKDGSSIESVDMGCDEMKGFRKYARKYGVAYHVEKDKSTDPPTYYIYFKAKDAVLTRNAIKEYVDNLYNPDKSKKDKSIAAKLVKAMEKVGKQKAKVKHKEHVR